MISIVIPLKDEESSLSLLNDKLVSVLNNENTPYELIFIDDGSTDGSWTILEMLTNKYPDKIKAIKFRKNFGKACALTAGFSEACGDIVLTMDADLQDDPEEIPNFLRKLDEGYDLVSGWKEKRDDPISKTFPSKIFNKVTGWLSGLKLHDFNCGFKAYKKEVLGHIQIYGELHRYIPVLAHDLGYKVAELPVKHHPRKYGRSKYGIERYIRGFLDLLTVLTITKFFQRPGHFFGGLGVFFGVAGLSCMSYLVILWFIGVRPIGTRPLFFFSMLALILSFQLISLGLLAELSLRNSTSRPIQTCIQSVIGKCSLNVQNDPQTIKPRQMMNG
jgi:glycosyltransferase involved in cell wall biosynthesis